MALDRDVLPRNQSLSNNSIKNPKASRELRVEYSAVKQEARISDKTDAQIRTQPIGLIYCAPKLKRVLKVVWTVVLLVYVVVLPILVMMLYRNYSNSLQQLDRLQERWKIHLDQEKGHVGKKRPTRNADDTMQEAFRQHTNCSRTVREMQEKLKTLQSRLTAHETRIKNLINASKNSTTAICRQLLATPVCTCDTSKENKDKVKMGPKGDTGVKGDTGLPGPKGPPGIPGFNASCKLTTLEEVKISTVYFRWGRKTCPKTAKLVFAGFMGSPYISTTRTGGGTNYVCLPSQNVTYKNFDHQPKTSLKTSFIDGVKYGSKGLFNTKNQPSLYGSAVCSVCQRPAKSVTLMMPGNTTCPSKWTMEYRGYLMADSRKKTQFVCVDENAEGDGGSVSQNHDIGTLEYVSAKWPACFSKDCGMYNTKDGFKCVVCSL